MDTSRNGTPNPIRPPDSSGDAWARRRDVAWAILGWGAIVAACLWLAGHVIHSLMIVAIAALLAYAMVPLVSGLRRFMPRWAAISLVYFALVALLATVSSLVVTSLITQISGLANQITSLLSPSHPGGNAPLFDALLKLGLTSSQITAARDFATAQLTTAVGGLAPFLAGAISAVFDMLVVIGLSIYLLVDGQRFAAWLRTGMPLSQRARGMLVLETLERVAGGYIRGQMIMCSSIGILVGLGLWALGVPFAALLGVAAFFLEFIPFIGPPISAAFAVLLAWPQGWGTIALLLGWFVIIHIVEGYILQPRLVGHSIGVNPTILILAALGAGEVFGLWGALFAAPVAGVAQSLLVAVWQSWRTRRPDQFPQDEASEGEAKPTAPTAAKAAGAEGPARTGA